MQVLVYIQNNFQNILSYLYKSIPLLLPLCAYYLKAIMQFTDVWIYMFVLNVYINKTLFIKVQKVKWGQNSVIIYVFSTDMKCDRFNFENNNRSMSFNAYIAL